jgi:periplasmic protein TonB
MGALNQRQGFLVSAIVHVVILSMLAARPEKRQNAVPVAQVEPKAERVFLPPPEVLRQLAPRPPAQPRPPVPKPPEPPPPDAQAKSKISIGAPSTERAKELILRREDDLTATPKGRPDARPSPLPELSQPSVASVDRAGVPTPQPSSPSGFQLPPGMGSLPTGKEAPPSGPQGSGPKIASSLQRLEQRLSQVGPQGIDSGTGKQMGPLFFDPEGADFTVWINHFKNEVYRNWIVPQAAALGFRGHVDIEFTVERDGSMTGIRMLKSSGTLSLDKAAENALRGSRLLPLPRDFGPPRVTMQVTFFYNEGPRES